MDGVTETEKRKRGDGNRRTILIIAGLFGLSCLAMAACIAAFVFVILRITQPVTDVGNAYLTALSTEDYAVAYELMSGSLQSEFGSMESFSSFVRERGILPVTWSFRSRSIENGGGFLSGRMIRDDGSQFTVNLTLDHYEEAGWLIEGFSFNPVE